MTFPTFSSHIRRYAKAPTMPHIDNDVKLDFKDVLLRPKRSTLKSRSEVSLLLLVGQEWERFLALVLVQYLFFGWTKCSVSCSYLQVDLTRSFSFRNSKQMYTGIPIIAANMDTVGTFEMAKVLSKVGLLLFHFLSGVQLCRLTAEVFASPPRQINSLAINRWSGCFILLFSPVLRPLYLISSKSHMSYWDSKLSFGSPHPIFLIYEQNFPYSPVQQFIYLVNFSYHRGHALQIICISTVTPSWGN